jgi:hypothetical protein
MPIRKTDKGWYWGSHGAYPTKAQALAVARAAYAHGYKEEEQMANKTGEFVGILLHSAVITHIMHLQSRSFAEHKALGEYYPAIPDLLDGLAEAIQGCTGELITGYPTQYAGISSSPLEYLTNLQAYVEDQRINLPQESNIQNEVDAIATLIDSTIYQLRFLA